ncbi:MAG: coproporphyrinogen dehydrogenase HemZ [Ruminococcaceae bacterium]|nr:coproporphyrinogen dehydrogenase HemZ [Oscillospiraceae bacterium]
MKECKIVINHPGDVAPYAVIEVAQIFDNVAEIETVSGCEKVAVNSIDAPLYDDTKELKRWLYRTISEVTGYKSPWGCMTGIRPAKIVNTLLESGMNREQVLNELMDFYYVSEKKASLAMETALVQAPFLNGFDEKVADWYANMPFCPTRCLYCSFTSNSITKYKKVVDKYLDYMEAELKATSSLAEKKFTYYENLYLGGGTPTSLNEAQFERYISMFGKYIDIGSLKEFSLEAGRPDSITSLKLKAAKRAGVTRISINPQTMNDVTLKRIGRAHTKNQVIEAFTMAREEGFDNINMDLIAGLPGETEEMFRYTLDCIEKLNPEGITVHTLSIKRAADLKRDEENRGALSEDVVGKMVDMAKESAGKMGMHPFYMYRQKHMLGNHENVSYCKPGFESPYNIHIMEEDRTILGIGAGAVTKVVMDGGNRIERAFNVKSVEYYLERMEQMVERKKNLLQSEN